MPGVTGSSPVSSTIEIKTGAGLASSIRPAPVTRLGPIVAEVGENSHGHSHPAQSFPRAGDVMGPDEVIIRCSLIVPLP